MAVLSTISTVMLHQNAFDTCTNCGVL